LAKRLDSDATGKALFARSGMLCWTIARIATGRLRAHPYLQYQKGPGSARRVADLLFACWSTLAARRRHRRFEAYALQFQTLARAVDDVRALTWSPDLSDALGRMQLRMHRLANELGAAARTECGATAASHQSAPLYVNNNAQLDEISVENNWPYLAI
jgi:hypothetical protein